MTEIIEEELFQADVPPREQLVDAGYVSARVLVNGQERFGIDVVGPAAVDTQWQAHTIQGIDASQFLLDWEHQQATCPEGHTSRSWTSISNKRHSDLIKIQFSITDCGSCPRRCDCVHSTNKYQRRTLTIRPQAQHAALQTARQRQRSETFQQTYALRAGIEATISQGVRAFDLRRSRYLGLPKPTRCATRCTAFRHRHFKRGSLIETVEVRQRKAEVGVRKKGRMKRISVPPGAKAAHTADFF
jgi:transposase